MSCFWLCCGNKADKGEYDIDMGQRNVCTKESPESEQATHSKEVSESVGGHGQVRFALDVGTSVKRTDSSPDVHEEEREKLGVDTAHLITQHGGREPNTESKEQGESTSSTLSNVGPCIEKPTASDGSRESPSPQPEAPPMPPHITPQVSKHPPTYPVSGGGSASASGIGQQLVITIKPQVDGSDRHQQQSDGTPSPTSPSGPGKDGSHTHPPDGLSNRASAEEKEETGGSHLKDKAPAPDHDSGEGKTEEPIDSAQHEREHSGPEPTPANGSSVDAEPLMGAAQDTGCQGVGPGEGQDSHKQQQQGKAGSQGKWPGTAQRVESPQSPGAEDALNPLKCVDCDRQLLAEEIQQRKEQGEALVCDECRSAHLSCLQDDSDGKGFLDQASADTRSSPDVVPEGPMCKLPGCPRQAQMKGRKYGEFCNKGHYQMYNMMTPSPVSLKPSTSQRSPMSPTAPSQSGGEAPSCQYPGCSKVCAVEDNRRFLACCEVHHKEEERQLRQFQECSGAQGGDGGGQGGDGGGQGSDGGGQGGDGGSQGGDGGGQGSDGGGQGSDGGGQGGDGGGQGGDGGGQGGDSGYAKVEDSCGQRDDSGDAKGGDSGGHQSDSGDQGGHGHDQTGDSGGQGGDGGGKGGDRGGWGDDSGAQRSDSGAQGHDIGPQGHDRSSRGGGHTPQHHPPAPTPSRKTCQYPGCQRPCYVEPDGRVHDFCGWTHAQQYRSQHTRSSRAVQSQHTDDESQGVLGWMAGKISGALWGSTPSSRNNSSSHGNPGNREKRNSWQRGSNAIKFYHKHEPYYEFTNFYQALLQIDDRVWATSENYFQAQKYIGTPLFDAIQQSQTAREAFDISRTPGLGLQWRRCDWEEVKEDVMYVALYAKFTQHEDLRKLLLDTGDRKLVEHTGRDSYWGDGGDGSGQNKLGKLLMKLREELRKEIEEVPVSQGGRKRRNEGGVELQSRAKKSSCSDVSDNGSSVD